MGVLTPWGLPDRTEHLYRALLRTPHAPAHEVAHDLGIDPVDATAALEVLVEIGLARLDDAGRPVAEAPGMVLTTMLSNAQRDIDARRLQLDLLRTALPSFAADHLIGQAAGWRESPVALLQESESFYVVEDFQRTTEGEVLSCHPVVDIDVDTDEYHDLILRQLGDGRRMRALYPSDVVRDPRRLEYVRFWANAGEQVRLVRDVPPQIAAWGDEIALISSTWAGEAGGKLVVRAPEIVAVVRALFELHWARGLPLARADRARQGPDSDVLELLGMGAKDDDIAQQLGVSLRTARRRVADTLADLGATTRFQAGMEAVRRGLM
jgi:hypothetical protein